MFPERSERRIAVSLFIVVLISFSRFAIAAHDQTCSSQWHVTGYFTPIELDYPEEEQIEINIEKLGRSHHSANFLKAVKVEGWGKTKAGWYLGRFSNKWHKSKYPLNSQGRPLTTGSIATDNKFIPSGSSIKIPSLPDKLKHKLYVSDDVGSAIKHTHIDIYTGEGREAEKITFEITGKDHTVCKLSSI